MVKLPVMSRRALPSGDARARPRVRQSKSSCTGRAAAALTASALLLTGCGGGRPCHAVERRGLVRYPEMGVAGEYYVTLPTGYTEPDTRRVASAFAKKYGGEIGRVDARGFAFAVADERAGAVANEPVVCTVEQSILVRVQ